MLAQPREIRHSHVEVLLTHEVDQVLLRSGPP
jgi:hypothetical protein